MLALLKMVLANGPPGANLRKLPVLPPADFENENHD
jgi:hypothetical protein